MSISSNFFTPLVAPPGTVATADLMGVCSFENLLRIHYDVETSPATVQMQVQTLG
jgi:hypothetical protein